MRGLSRMFVCRHRRFHVNMVNGILVNALKGAVVENIILHYMQHCTGIRLLKYMMENK